MFSFSDLSSGFEDFLMQLERSIIINIKRIYMYFCLEIYMNKKLKMYTI